MNPAEVIRIKRDGGVIDSDMIREFVGSYLDGDIAEYQMSALLMAIYLRDMTGEEAAALTDVYIHSGMQIDWSDLPGIPVDKHSTGGVGDKVSLILAPLVAACGGYVPMLSGRGLGHTGGTLDKLESIPGFNTQLSIEKFKKQVGKIGCAIAGQSKELAPADGRVYALRDVTATVESIPLISASIMSKKIAEGSGGLILDVKVGSGAFMETIERAEELSRMLITIGKNHGQDTRAVLSNMGEPLGCAVGNSLEAIESILFMRGEKKLDDLREITIVLAGEMLHMAKLCNSVEVGMEIASGKLDDGSALDKFRKMIEAQDGNPAVCDDIDLFPRAEIKREISSPVDGYVNRIDTRRIGMAGVEIGAGRKLSSDRIDPRVGFDIYTKIGDKIDKGQPLGIVYASNEEHAEFAISEIQKSYNIIQEKIEKPNLILNKIT